MLSCMALYIVLLATLYNVSLIYLRKRRYIMLVKPLYFVGSKKHPLSMFDGKLNNVLENANFPLYSKCSWTC